MKTILLYIMTLFFSCSSLAHTGTGAEDIIAKINFNYQQTHSKDSCTIKTDLTFSQSNRQGVVVLNDSTSNNPKILLLTHVDRFDSKSAKLSFIVMNLNNKPEVIAKPVIIANINQQAKIVLMNKDSKISLEVLSIIKS